MELETKRKKINNTDPVFIKIFAIFFVVDFAFIFTFLTYCTKCLFILVTELLVPLKFCTCVRCRLTCLTLISVPLGLGKCTQGTLPPWTLPGKKPAQALNVGLGLSGWEFQGCGGVSRGMGHRWAHALRSPGSLLVKRRVVGGGPKRYPLESSSQPQNLLEGLRRHRLLRF